MVFWVTKIVSHQISKITLNDLMQLINMIDPKYIKTKTVKWP
jgi:hypothetical protein